MVKIVGHYGGSQTINAVEDGIMELLALNLKPAQIVKIAESCNGSNNIRAVKDSFKELNASGLTPDIIVILAGKRRGCKNLEAAIKMQRSGFTAEQIIEKVGLSGGAKTVNNQAIEVILSSIKPGQNNIVQLDPNGGFSEWGSNSPIGPESPIIFSDHLPPKGQDETHEKLMARISDSVFQFPPSSTRSGVKSATKPDKRVTGDVSRGGNKKIKRTPSQEM